jgi:outer membrane protein TolC
MRTHGELIRIISVASAFLALGLLTSCNSLMCQRTGPPGFISDVRSMLADPFRPVDPVGISNANAAIVVTNTRVVPVTAALGKRHLTLEECRSIALGNNLELQAARVDELTKRAIAYSNKTKMLPHFLFSGELSERDNPPYSFSDILGREGLNPNPGAPAGTGVNNYSTSHERSTWRYVLETRWSPTDAALAYYLTKSGENDTLKSHYQKVRAAQKLVTVVDASFFRLLALQECLSTAQSLAEARSDIAYQMKKLFQNRMVNVDEYNRAQQQAVRARRLLGKTHTEMEKQLNILASAMGLSPERCTDGGLIVVGPLVPPCFDQPVCRLEMIAVQNRPEAVEAGLNHLNSANDLKRTLIKYCPKVAGFWRYTRDKDRFLYNKDWKEVGLSVYFDLLDWLSNVKESQAARHNTVKTQREMGAVALGITSQVRLAALNYYDARDELGATEQAVGSTSEVVRVAAARTAKDDLDKISLESAKADLLQDKLERLRALGEVNATLAELQGAMGTNHSEAPVCK